MSSRRETVLKINTATFMGWGCALPLLIFVGSIAAIVTIYILHYRIDGYASFAGIAAVVWSIIYMIYAGTYKVILTNEYIHIKNLLENKKILVTDLVGHLEYVFDDN